ncbi:hypothetical protein SUGI_1068880 [Cryptomeria japonica]|uniref:uncharacterized protein LOC131073383 n=1 Tax=Cryptomeria japonica TaxID=3369 RepID=UPI00241490BA|nr:uncharacterized protein LOC131073383 [Cryptomeria japonica]GLJ50217.1 hypothetical protein SUGI_1068880 [Cryptomeria japonica]
MLKTRIHPSGLGSSQIVASFRNSKPSGYCRFHVGSLSNHLSSTPLHSRKQQCRPLLNKNGMLHNAPKHMSTKVISNAMALEIGMEEEDSKKDFGVSGEFLTAVGLIMGTAVGPGILGLPAATLNAGTLPSTMTILGSWVYVISSILLVAELSCAVMEDKGVDEVSFTGLAMHTLGDNVGILVAVVYAILNYALLVACIAGLGSIVQTWMPFLSTFVACAVLPVIVGGVIGLASFKVIDGVNRVLCALMVTSISALVGVGVFVKRHCIFDSLNHAVWASDVLLPAVPVTVLTLGFHVITPFICKVVGRKPQDARKAITCGGAVPLAMVLAWNAVILGLAHSSTHSRTLDPIKLLLSLNSSAVPAVQLFAFSALGTTLIGYALSFPKQLYDTICLIRTVARKHFKTYLGNFPNKMEAEKIARSCNGAEKVAQRTSTANGSVREASLDDLLEVLEPGRMGFPRQQEIALRDSSSSGYGMKMSAYNEVIGTQHDGNILNRLIYGEDKKFSRHSFGKSLRKRLTYLGINGGSIGSKNETLSTETEQLSSFNLSKSGEALMLCLVLGPPILISTFFPKAFAAALDFAGVYANCFLFGILPPLMAWIYRYNNVRRGKGMGKRRVVLVPGGKGPLAVLFAIAFFLGFRLPS